MKSLSIGIVISILFTAVACTQQKKTDRMWGDISKHIERAGK